ncbi:MAG: VOC family protein [Nitrospinaceae bacterium]|nr:VOC family protein [Nitrospinaceae bacterium]NIR53683.1 VOC family protein [Nitrospinaceae bacterium]NIS84094.1 VOC family protein [Nitrospinaceae bacterium]NIT80894.1 VOC family protein [Nitrospinaceae bacterium]NIU43193.1 VOC family protein [Nitrospinaceae bacterium]
MKLKQINHLAFITRDIRQTIRFYRDLLGMELEIGMGYDGYRHYFFKTGDNYIAFFEYDQARPMVRKDHGEPTSEPLGFDHVAFGVERREDLFALRDRLEAAGFPVRGAIDHGIIWSIYFFDPNNIPLEAAWQCLEIRKSPAVLDDRPLDLIAEGSAPRTGIWPEVTRPTPPEEMTAQPGGGYTLRDHFLKQGWAVKDPEFSRQNLRETGGREETQLNDGGPQASHRCFR